MPTIVDPNTGQVIQLPYGDEGMGPPPMGGSPPPEGGDMGGLLSGLMGAMGGAPMGPGGPGAPEAPQFQSPADAIRDIFEYVRNHPYLQMETDDADLAQINKIISSLSDLLAKNQKQAEAALGIGPAQKFMLKNAPQSPLG